jgi:hypothetical protein
MKAAALALLLLCLAAPTGGAQQLSGRVEKAGRGVAEVPVTLHRVTRDSSGVVAQSRSGEGGQFQFNPPPPAADGFTVYFATAEWQGVRYFGPPLHPTDGRGDYRVAVFDTIAANAESSSLRVVRRDLILLPEADGGWEINEVLRVENTGQRTLVSVGGMPTWEFRLPAGASAFEVGDGGIPADRIQRMGARILINAPLPPGSHDAVVRYRLPGTRSALTLDIKQATGELGLLVREPSPRLRVVGLTRVPDEQLAGERFTRYTASELRPGARVRIEWEGSAAPLPPVAAAIVVAGLVLLGGAGWAVRSNRSR